MGMGICTLECPLGSMFSFKLKHTAAPPLFTEYFEFEIGPSNKDHCITLPLFTQFQPYF